MSNRSSLRELPKALKASLLSLWAFLSVVISSVISKWLYDSLVNVPNLPQAIISFLSLKLFSLSNFILIISVFSIPLYLINSRLREEWYSIRKKVEKDLTEFIYDILESHLDDNLIKIVERMFSSNGNSCNPLCILESLCQDYFVFDVASMTVFRPDELGEYLTPTFSVPPAIRMESEKDVLKFYIGDDNTNFHRRGLAGFTYKNKELVKIYIDQDRNAYRWKENENSQSIEEPFPAYRDLGINEFISIHSIAAIPLFGTHNSQRKVLGVVCVDSTDAETFKSQMYDDKLIKAARCLAIVIEIQDLLKELY